MLLSVIAMCVTVIEIFGIVSAGYRREYEECIGFEVGINKSSERNSKFYMQENLEKCLH